MRKRIVSMLLCLSMVIPLLQIGTISVSAESYKVYLQTQGSWSSHPYTSANHPKATIYTAGCALLSLTNAVYHLNGKFLEPTMLADFSKNNGYRALEGTDDSKSKNFFKGASKQFGKEYNFEFIKATKAEDELKDALQDDNVAVWHASGHFMAIVKYNGGKYLVLDSYPSKKRGTYTTHYIWKTFSDIRNGGITSQGFHIIGKRNSSSDEEELTKNTKYKTPISCVAYKQMDVYYSSGKVESGHYISAGDACKIDAVYTNGLCSVTYPTSSGKREAYAKFNDFVPNPVSLSSYTAEKAYTTYNHSDKKKKSGSLSVNSICTIVGQTGNMYQLIYPISGGYKLGWIDTNELKDIVKPVPEPDKEEKITVPAPVAKGYFDNSKVGKGIVVMAPNEIVVNKDKNWKISKNDICIIKDVNKTSGKCSVTYPTSGKDDVFTSGDDKRTVTLNITQMIPKYKDDFEAYTLKSPNKYKAYPLDSTNDKGRNWYVSKGDTYYTVAYSNKMTEVLYPCTEGTHKGYSKLGWIELDYYYLDLNGYLDGQDNGSLCGYGYCDISINGEKEISQAKDYYVKLPYGSTYEIKNIKALARHTYNGVKTGSLKGTIKAKTEVRLNFTTNPPVLQDIFISSNPYKTEYLEGEWLDTNGLVVTARYDDASTQNVTGSCGISGYDSSPGVKTINVNFGGYETAFTVNVRSKSPTKIEIVSLPTKIVYNTEDEIDLAGLTVKVLYDNQTFEIVNDYDLSIGEDILLEVGTANIKVAYEYNDVVQYTSFEITVNAKYTVVDLGDDFTAYIQYPVNGKYITREENSDVQLRSYNNDLSQVWHFIKQDDGTYKIFSMAKEDYNVLDVSGWGSTSGTNVGTYYDNDYIDENSSSNQRWQIIQSENGYRLKPLCSECMLDVAGGGDAADGTNIQMWEYLEYGAQEFNINKVVFVTGIRLNKTSISLGLNETAKISASILPSNATNQNVVWSSSDDTIADVENGTVTAKGLGEAVITATTEDGGYSVSCSISVTSLSLKGDVNGDSEIDIADALLVMKHDAGLTMIDDAFQQAADVNNDGEIDIADAILIMKYDAGLINKFN